MGEDQAEEASPGKIVFSTFVLRPLRGRIPAEAGPLLRAARPDADEWAKTKRKKHLLEKK